MWKKIKVVNIQPGYVLTDITINNTNKTAVQKFAGIYDNTILTVSDISKCVYFVINTSENVAINEILIEPISRSII